MLTIIATLIATPYILTFYLIRSANKQSFGKIGDEICCLIILFFAPITIWMILLDEDVPKPKELNSVKAVLRKIFGIKDENSSST